MAEEIQNGTFSRLSYRPKKGMLSITANISEFLRENIFPRYEKLQMTEEDKIWIEDWMEPFLGEVGVFVINELHMKDFIRTFKFKGSEKERAERLFNVVRQEIKL